MTLKILVYQYRVLECNRVSKIITKNMKKKSLGLLIAFLSLINVLLANEREDAFVQMDGEPEISRASDTWLKVSVPFKLNGHPEIENLEGGRPSSLEEVFNPDFLDDLEIRLTICFRNEFKRKYARGDKKDIKFNEYYSSDLKIQVLEIDRSTKIAVFLFPAIIAKRDEYAGSVPKLVGYVVEFSRKGKPFNVSKSIVFENYTNDEVLKKFKEDALNRSTENEGILVPGHLMDTSNLKYLGPVDWNL